MRLVAFDKSGTPALAGRRGDELVDLSVAAPKLPTTLAALIAGGDEAMDAAKSAIDGAGADAAASQLLASYVNAQCADRRRELPWSAICEKIEAVVGE